MKTKQFIVVGLGRFGRSVAKELFEMGHEVLGVDKDEENVQAIKEYLTHGIVGDVTREDLLSSLGVRNFDVLIVGVGSDYEASILTVIMAKELGVKKIVAKASSTNHLKVLYRLGADKVVIPERDIGRRVAHNLNFSSNIIDVVELSEDFGILEINALEEWWNKTLKESNIRLNHHLNVVAIRRADKVYVNPSSEFIIFKDDHLYVLGENEGLLDIERAEQA